MQCYEADIRSLRDTLLQTLFAGYRKNDLHSRVRRELLGSLSDCESGTSYYGS
jgi:hypothetical protein